MSINRYSLNLSPRYAPNWGPWEVAREVLCNALDAAADDLIVTTNGTDTLKVWTPTVPDLSEVFIIGEGSKAPGGETIGQFGEGLKIAALVATRAPRSSMMLRLQGRLVSFEFAPVMGSEVLHALSEETNEDFAGYEATIHMPGIALAFAGRLLPDRTEGPLPKVNPQELRVYCKGVFVCSRPDVGTIWDWNLNSLQINRDRSMVEQFHVVLSISAWLEENASDEQCDQIISNSTRLEASQVITWTNKAKFHRQLAGAFFRIHGEKAVLQDLENATATTLAKKQGFKPVTLNKALTEKLNAAGVPMAVDVVPKHYDLEVIDIAPYRDEIAKLRTLDAIIAAPSVKVCIFANRSEQLKGRADIEDQCIWLSEGLFTPGNWLELARTYLHELGHVMSEAGDSTTEFESALDGIAGRLAVAFIGGAQ